MSLQLPPPPGGVLILHESTNNLDLPSQQVPARAVQAFAGTVLFISHDEDFVAEIGVTRTLELPRGLCSPRV